MKIALAQKNTDKNLEEPYSSLKNATKLFEICDNNTEIFKYKEN